MPEPLFPQAILDLLAVGGERPVFEHGNRVVTASEMYGMVRRIHGGLLAAAIGPGSSIAVGHPVHPSAFAAIVAAHATGARIIGGSSVRPGMALPADLTLDEAAVAWLLESVDDGRPVVAAGRPGDVGRVVLTSGSTGRPKGCAQTYAAMTASWIAHPDRWPPAIRALAPRLGRHLVFGSLTSQVMWEYGMLTLAAGGVMVTADPPGFPDALVRHRATSSVITVGKLNQLVRSQRQNPVDLSRVEALMVSGSPLDPHRLADAVEVLGPVVFHGYGQTETGMISMLTPAEMLESPEVMGTVGRLPTAVAAEVRDGELYVRTPAQASSYWEDPDESASVFRDGWVRTRDLASISEDGHVRLLGRARDVIIVQATLVYAGPIERALAAHPDVAEAYVVGAPDNDTGEAVHAFVVPLPGVTPSLGDLQARVAAELGAAATPATINVIDSVPLAPSGKPDKRALLGKAVGRTDANTTRI